MARNKTKIKIGTQRQAKKPIYLMANGSLVCGNFEYKGRYKEKFKGYYERIVEYSHPRPKDGILDVSNYKFWDAIKIYDQYLVPKWQRVITVEKMRKFADESEIALMIEDIKPEFRRAVGLKWKRMFKKLDPNDENTPKMAWQIL